MKADSIQFASSAKDGSKEKEMFTAAMKKGNPRETINARSKEGLRIKDYCNTIRFF